MPYKLTQKQRDFLKPALDRLQATVGELQGLLRKLPPNGPGEPTGGQCMVCECEGYDHPGPGVPALCTRKLPNGKTCGHAPFAHLTF
jgi:hypothetical protein